ncbi:tripartite tricarboxylate transporter substrate binding protein [Caenimonas sp. SL110]|uniref:Bug family tripartite tricarboxylate transporter substrate binding protein n=1 Tax=Caenimonas sp. SL110 TaxID=1450524 RepID=UPI000652A475|nr:tripartite tricarboxylate transporter substrate binding protein [Caenimonas sp. SL110]
MVRKFASRLLASVVATATVFATGAMAQAYPNKPIRMIVPYAAGGPTDVLARVMAQKLTESVGQNVIVENKPGANGIPGTDAIAKATPDGYTIGLSTIGPLAVNPSLIANVPYDPLKDFAPIMLLARSYSMLAVHPSVPANNMRELVALAKANPGKYSYATGGVGTTQHLSGELLSNVAGIKMLHVPYKGEGAAQSDLLGGQVHMMFTSTIIANTHVKAGKLRAIAVASAQRLPSIPDVPAIAETYPGFEVTAWFGMVAPAGTPEPIVRRLNDAFQAVLKNPEVVKKLEDLGALPAGGPPSDLMALIRSELPKWRDVIRKADIKAE